MNYWTLLREMQKTHTVALKGIIGTGKWAVVLLSGDRPATLKTFTTAEYADPEQAIRVAYLYLNPVPQSNQSGKLSQG